MTLDEYQKAVERTAAGPLEGDIARPAVFALGLGGEAGEVLDLLKKHWGHGNALDRDKLKKELGDTLWYLAALAWSMGFSLDDIGVANIAKLRARFPNGFSGEAARARADEAPAGCVDPTCFCDYEGEK